MAQSNAIVEMVVVKKSILGLAQPDASIRIGLGLLMALLTGAVILGGIRSIARFCGFIVPFMAFFYVGGCIVILLHSWDKIPGTISLIVSSAFTGQAALGGFVGAGIAEAVRYGIARGLFSNESGLGSAPIAAAAARTSDPVRQALVSGTGTFWDTVVVCALTGLVIVSSGDWTTPDINKAKLCDLAFHHLGTFGDMILIGGLLTFVFSTILGWGYYGEKSVEYLLGVRAVLPYRLLWVVAVFIGAIWKSDAVWNFCDIMNGLMALPNLAALLLLSGVIAAETRRYFSQSS